MPFLEEMALLFLLCKDTFPHKAKEKRFLGFLLFCIFVKYYPKFYDKRESKILFEADLIEMFQFIRIVEYPTAQMSDGLST